MTILDEIAAKTRLRAEQAKKTFPLEEIRKAVASLTGNTLNAKGLGPKDWGLGAVEALPFECALKKPGLSFICEVKKASPSKGVIAEDFPWLEIAKEYEAAGADAVSVLTEPDYFLGRDQYLREIAGAVSIPALRKDFTIDPYQIYEAKYLGAGAVLLICALLPAETLKSYITIAEELELSALVEAHTEAEIEQAVEAGARIIGINNRNLKNFAVDIEACAKLRSHIPPHIVTVSESGIQSAEDVRVLNGMGFNAVLIGESIMRSADKTQFLKDLKSLI